MPRKTTVPEWFKLTNYGKIRKLKGVDWLIQFLLRAFVREELDPDKDYSGYREEVLRQKQEAIRLIQTQGIVDVRPLLQAEAIFGHLAEINRLIVLGKQGIRFLNINEMMEVRNRFENFHEHQCRRLDYYNIVASNTQPQNRSKQDSERMATLREECNTREEEIGKFTVHGRALISVPLGLKKTDLKALFSDWLDTLPNFDLQKKPKADTWQEYNILAAMDLNDWRKRNNKVLSDYALGQAVSADRTVRILEWIERLSNPAYLRQLERELVLPES